MQRKLLRYSFAHFNIQRQRMLTAEHSGAMSPHNHHAVRLAAVDMIDNDLPDRVGEPSAPKRLTYR